MDEYIKRELALKTIRDNFCTYFPNVLDVVRRIPTADVQPIRHGRWIITDDVEQFVAICSECGRTEDSRCIDDMPYCHCGARMDLKDGDTNG